jgi:YVTN family beta-propeller protein
MAVSSDAQTIYIADKANQAFGVLDLAGSRSIILKPTVWPVDMAITPDGRTVVSVGCKQICTPGFIQLFDTASQRFTQEIAVDGNPYRVVLSPDGSQAYVANLTGPSVSFVDLATRQVTKTVPVAVQPTGLAIAPGGATLYVASQTQGRLSVVDVASGTVTAQLSVPLARDVVATPDGRRVYVSSENRVLAVDVQALAAAP